MNEAAPWACLDVSYRHGVASAAAVLFRGWTDAEACGQRLVQVSPIEPYIPGAFYRRELPCLLAVLEQIEEPLAGVIIDGYVWLSEKQRLGLGARLFQTLEERTPVIGVAKSVFRGSSWAVPVLRGRSQQPLYVTAAGVETSKAAEKVRAMHGRNRIPTLLALVDRLTRET
jgi:deoxyribonuclease V